MPFRCLPLLCRDRVVLSQVICQGFSLFRGGGDGGIGLSRFVTCFVVQLIINRLPRVAVV